MATTVVPWVISKRSAAFDVGTSTCCPVRRSRFGEARTGVVPRVNSGIVTAGRLSARCVATPTHLRCFGLQPLDPPVNCGVVHRCLEQLGIVLELAESGIAQKQSRPRTRPVSWQ